MCGIVGAVAQRPVAEILVEGLKRLEYRGYDSAGIAIIDAEENLNIRKKLGKVAVLEESLQQQALSGTIGIAHTRWATHGKPSEGNAHPHHSNNNIAVVHNGIIENHVELRQELSNDGYEFISETDTEVIVHLLHKICAQGSSLIDAVKQAVTRLDGAFGLAAIMKDEPSHIVVARSGSPLVIGKGIGENFIASDYLALRQVTDRFIYLEEGDIADIRRDGIDIWDQQGNRVKRDAVKLSDQSLAADKGNFKHYMLKEIYEQPEVIQNALNGRIGKSLLNEEAFGAQARELFDRVKQVQIVACGTSYHSGLVARYWIEAIAGIPCQIEVASEFRYRKFTVQPDTLFITISQSGETADTLAALRLAKTSGFAASLAVCNVAQSSLARESDLVVLTHAGPEIGVASTKAFTTQLTVLLLLTIALARRNNSEFAEAEIIAALKQLPDYFKQCLSLDGQIERMSEQFADKNHALFLGRGIQYPVAMEGALKLKEISYIHAEAYPAGELKHGPLALVDADMPIVAVAPNDELLEKLKSNLEEVQARGGKLFVFADKNAGFSAQSNIELIELPHIHEVLAPIAYTLPLQLLSYHVAVLKGTDVDQPRNLAKSVTVE